MSLTSVILCVVVVILLAGLIGGGVNLLQARNADDPLPKSNGYYFLLSGAAAFSVPLFLSLTKSELLRNVLSAKTEKVEDWFILFAVCLIAAIYAQTFLESVSKKLLQRMDSVEQSSRQSGQIAVDALNRVEAASDDDVNQTTDEAAVTRFAAARSSVETLSPSDPDERKVLEALRNPKYQLGRRSLGGIVLETKLSRQTVEAILTKLVADGTVQRIAGELSGADYYMLRPSA